MRTIVENHPLVGKVVDFDWRNGKEKGTEYDASNMNVVQNVLVTSAKKDCYGDVWLYSDNFMPQKENRVCKIY